MRYLYSISLHARNTSTDCIQFQLTIVDIAATPLVSNINLLIPIVAQSWPRLHNWFNTMRSLPSYEKANAPGLNALKTVLQLSTDYPIAWYRVAIPIAHIKCLLILTIEMKTCECWVNVIKTQINVNANRMNVCLFSRIQYPFRVRPAMHNARDTFE